jgi:glycerol uptake facilitator-like aquaporin
MAYAIGHISGCHLNPAVPVGLVVGKRFPASERPAYAIAQVLGGLAGSSVLYLIASGKEGLTWRVDLPRTATEHTLRVAMPWAPRWLPRWC